MPPQVQLVPQEKYDVIHYLRENFLKPHNPGQYFALTSEYLDGLPKGSCNGPVPAPRERHPQQARSPRRISLLRRKPRSLHTKGNTAGKARASVPLGFVALRQRRNGISFNEHRLYENATVGRIVAMLNTPPQPADRVFPDGLRANVHGRQGWIQADDE